MKNKMMKKIAQVCIDFLSFLFRFVWKLIKTKMEEEVKRREEEMTKRQEEEALRQQEREKQEAAEREKEQAKRAEEVKYPLFIVV